MNGIGKRLQGRSLFPQTSFGTCHAFTSPVWPRLAGRPRRRSIMAHRETKHLVAEAENSVIKAIHGAGDVAGAIADATSHTLVRTLQSTRATGSELDGMIRDTLKGTIQAVAQVGGEVESAASSIMVGALRGAQQVGKASAEAVSASAAALVKGAADVGGDVGRTAKG